MAAKVSNLDASALFSVKSLVAVITGGGSGKQLISKYARKTSFHLHLEFETRILIGKLVGLGASMARALDANGASKVFIIGRREESLKKIAISCPKGSVIPIVGDVTSKESLKNCVEQVSKEVDHVDVLVANSGVSGPSAQPQPKTNNEPFSLAEIQEHLWNVPMEEFNRTSEVNVTGVFYTAVAFLPLLDAANKLRPAPSTFPRAQIVATGSIGGFNRRPLAGYAYGASKAGVHHMVKQLATTLAPYNIRANCIAPGLYGSEMTDPLFDRMGLKAPSDEGSITPDQVPATRAGGEEDISGVILFLSSKAGAYTNGSIVVTDGGRLSVYPATY